MTRLEPIIEEVQWHEGMMLAPQQFQQMTRRIEGVIHRTASIAQPFNWGVWNVKIDINTLMYKGLVRVQELDAILPDGLIAHYSSSGADMSIASELEALSVSVMEEEGQPPIAYPCTVYLGVIKRPSAVRNEKSRYRSVFGDTVIDENTNDNPVDIPRLRPRLELLVGEAVNDRYTYFPLIKVDKIGNDHYVPLEYTPPTLRIDTDSAIFTICERIITRLRQKALYVSEQIRRRSAELGRDGLQDQRFILRAITFGVPELEIRLATVQSHPFELYTLLCAIIGSLSSISYQMLPPALEFYDHNNLLFIFEQIERHIMRILDEAVAESYRVYDFVLQKGQFVLPVRPEWYDADLYIAVYSNDSALPKETIAWINSAIITSGVSSDILYAKRDLGYERKYIDNPQYTGLAIPPLVHLFELDTAQNLEVNHILTIHNRTNEEVTLRPTRISLYVKFRTAAQKQ
jgi:type VI secretion system protein ImpJ